LSLYGYGIILRGVIFLGWWVRYLKVESYGRSRDQYAVAELVKAV
jgi:hypothetical protein